MVCPRQTNGFDCGIFTILAIERLALGMTTLNYSNGIINEKRLLFAKQIFNQKVDLGRWKVKRELLDFFTFREKRELVPKYKSLILLIFL
jgi:hypothetical protein